MKRSQGFLFGAEKVGDMFRAVVYWNIDRPLFLRRAKSTLGYTVDKGQAVFKGSLYKDENKAKAAAARWVARHSVFKNVKRGYCWRLQGGIYERVINA